MGSSSLCHTHLHHLKPHIKRHKWCDCRVGQLELQASSSEEEGRYSLLKPCHVNTLERNLEQRTDDSLLLHVKALDIKRFYVRSSCAFCCGNCWCCQHGADISFEPSHHQFWVLQSGKYHVTCCLLTQIMMVVHLQQWDGIWPDTARANKLPSSLQVWTTHLLARSHVPQLLETCTQQEAS